jgi:hypothetical protein
MPKGQHRASTPGGIMVSIEFVEGAGRAYKCRSFAYDGESIAMSEVSREDGGTLAHVHVPLYHVRTWGWHEIRG